ncbi:hypothetical protein [Paenibacillus sp. DMB5]|uniref:hypothetical protein n=1 Tax=Paenibacillus sp. DMB5 TaxID=1780103 RepID=UPI00076C912A|nr:hypothetical protein [Paenibacillus sp. DMB5]KUP21145.1 hypothetical protein AWJ19_08045 [Paenibacillus sp. DMB5]
MGNRWEVDESRTHLSKVCPCGKGGISITTNSLSDDYGRTKEEDEDPVMTCMECHTKYISTIYGWLPRELAPNYQEMNVQYEEQKIYIHQLLINKYLTSVTESLRNLGYKELYEILNKTPELSTHNTYPTFRKHMNKYGKPSAFRDIDRIAYFKTLIYLINYFNLGLNQEEEALISEWELVGKKKRDYLKSQSIVHKTL